MESYTVEENHIGSAVSEILRYKQTSCYFDTGFTTHIYNIHIKRIWYKNVNNVINVEDIK